MWKKQGSWNFFHAKLIPNSSLIGLQKGVNKTSKGHLLEANWASLRALKSIYSFSSVSFFITK